MTENSFDKIKKLMKIIGGKVIIVEDGKPTFVVINVDEYINFEKMEEETITDDSVSNTKSEEGVNKDVNIWKDKQDERKLRQMKPEKYNEKNTVKEKNLDDDIIIENL